MAGAYDGLRARFLGLRPDEAGVAPTERHPRVYAGMLESDFGTATMTLVCVADGTTSIYLSNGGGFIGVGEHPTVAAATLAYLDALEGSLDTLEPDPDEALPRDGLAIIRALTYDGRRRLVAPEDDLGMGQHPGSALFYAAQDVITQIRLVEQARRS